MLLVCLHWCAPYSLVHSICIVHSILGLNINGHVSSDRREIADSLNNYFTTIARTLVYKLPIFSGKFGERPV